MRLEDIKIGELFFVWVDFDGFGEEWVPARKIHPDHADCDIAFFLPDGDVFTCFADNYTDKPLSMKSTGV